MNSVSIKITDFTLKTIQALIKQGETDAMLALELQVMNTKIANLSDGTI
jgi:hypothetical protein